MAFVADDDIEIGIFEFVLDHPKLLFPCQVRCVRRNGIETCRPG